MTKKVLVISVSKKGKGGIASVVTTFTKSTLLNDEFNIEYFNSVIPGDVVTKLISTIYAFFIFPFKLLFNNYKVAHIHGGSVLRKSYFALWLDFFNIPIIYQNHAAVLDEYYRNTEGLKRKYIDYIFSKYTLRLCLGHFWVTELEMLTKKKWDILYNPVPQIPIKKKEHEYCNFTFMGELSARKGIHDLLSAFARVKSENARLLIAGNGDVVALKLLCDELLINNKVEFLGWINNDQKLELLAKTDVVILPSYAEGLPMSVLEAMSVGLPVITTPVGAIEDAITHNENGILVEPGNVGAISDAIAELSEDRKKREYLGKNAETKYIENFKDDVVSKCLAAYYNRVIDGVK